jgi:thioredoxin-related protein
MAATYIGRRNVLQHLLLTFGFQPVLSYAQGQINALPRSKSLRISAQEASRQGQPLVLMVTLKGCPWCDFVRNNHLLPLIQERGIFVVEIDLGNTVLPIQDFSDLQTTHKAVAQGLNVRRAPTLLFLNGAGAEIAPRLVGVSSQDYYGVYLEQRIDAARKLVS